MTQAILVDLERKHFGEVLVSIFNNHYVGGGTHLINIEGLTDGYYTLQTFENEDKAIEYAKKISENAGIKAYVNHPQDLAFYGEIYPRNHIEIMKAKYSK